MMLKPITPVFTAIATATGGRNGRTRSSDGLVNVELSVPKEMGGPGRPGAVTPEHLFAAGYAACFGGALEFVARQKNQNASNVTVTASVSIGPSDGGGLGLAVHMRVEDRTLPHAVLASLVKEVHERNCPYSIALRGNVDVQFEILSAS